MTLFGLKKTTLFVQCWYPVKTAIHSVKLFPLSDRAVEWSQKFLSSALAFIQELKAAQITNLAKYSVYLFICSENNNHNGEKGTKRHLQLPINSIDRYICNTS